MINSLRPPLTDGPAVLQQKWHWDHLSMLPDNAHKCEICQPQYVNNHNCTGWGHVRANPAETPLADVRWAGLSRESNRCGRSWWADVSANHEPPVSYVNVGHTAASAPAKGPEKANIESQIFDSGKVEGNLKKLGVRGRREGEKKSNQTSWGADEEPR